MNSWPWNSLGQNTGVAIPFSRRSSQPRDGTQVSHIAGGFFTSWVTREAQTENYLTAATELTCVVLLNQLCLTLFETPWTVARQVTLSMEFSRQEYWSGLPFAPPGYLPDPGMEPRSPTLQADSLLSQPPGNPKWIWNLPNPGIEPMSLMSSVLAERFFTITATWEAPYALSAY